MSTYPYLSPSYFAPSYFSGIWLNGSGADQVSPSDHAVMVEVASILSSTGLFGRVIYAEILRGSIISAVAKPTLVLVPMSWREFDDAGTRWIRRRLEYQIFVSIRRTNAWDAHGELDRLGNAVQNLLDASTLGGLVIPELTRVRSGGFDLSVPPPEYRTRLDCTAAYLVDRTYGRVITRD